MNAAIRALLFGALAVTWLLIFAYAITMFRDGHFVRGVLGMVFVLAAMFYVFDREA